MKFCPLVGAAAVLLVPFFAIAQQTCSLSPIDPAPSAFAAEPLLQSFPAGTRFIDKTGKLLPATATPKQEQNGGQESSPQLVPFQPVAGGANWGFRDSKSSAVKISPQFRGAYPFRDSLAAVQHPSGLWGFIDQTGALRIPPKYKFVGSFSDGFAAVDLCNKCAYIAKNGEPAFPGEFHACHPFQQGVAKVEFTPNRWGFIDKTGRTVATLNGEWGAFALLSENLIPSEKTGVKGIGFVSPKGEFAIAPRFAAVHPFSEGLAAVSEDDELWGYIDKTGAYVIKPQFCDPGNATLGQFRDGLANACDPKTKKQGFINRQGQFVIAPKFGDPNLPPMLTGFNNGLAYVQLVSPKGSVIKEGYINTKGLFVWVQPTRQK